jgi:hypothetical protein
MYSITTNDNKYTFTVTRHKRHGYNIWCLSEFSLPNESGVYMRAKLIAQFGNTKNKESYIYARACANSLCDAWNK